MADTVTGLPKRGYTYHGGTPANIDSSKAIEGHPMAFADDYPDGPGVRIKRSDDVVEAILVRNVSGGTLLGGRQVRWKTGQRRRQVDGYTNATAGEVAGVVDDQLPSTGVANNDLFWLIVKGHVLLKTPLAGDAGNVFNEGDVLVALTAVTSGATTAGRPAVLATAATTNTAAAIVNRFARVVSAMTTAQTNANMLAYLDVR
jgi:hypothetical protein